MAEEKAAYIESLAHPMDTLVLLSEALNYDFARKGLDEPFTDEELAAIGGLQALRDRVVRLAGTRHPTTRDFIKYSGRGTLREFTCFVGAPGDVADQMEEWFGSEACDGFVIAATHMPGAYEDFVRLVVPELQRRGLYHREYTGVTLRENLGLPRAQRGDWLPGALGRPSLLHD
jgi:alkanesulfonate monooxygenase SsuD/methylene tetrahydromethanopterin reductase-like flavin-dependent oxidoreductase (luciferase family)